jgi:hypothetical protein
MFFVVMRALPNLRHRLPGAAVDVFYIDGGCSRISGTPSQGARRQCFLVLMVEAPRSPALPHRGSIVDVFCVDGGHSRISGTAS